VTAQVTVKAPVAQTATAPVAAARRAEASTVVQQPAPKASPAPASIAAARPAATPQSGSVSKPAVTARLAVKAPAAKTAMAPAAATPWSGTAEATAVVVQAGMPKYLTFAELVGTAIEVRNGTWTRHLARDTRWMLSQEGFRVDKIGNHIDFGAKATIIYYRPGSARVARAVRRTFFPGAVLAQATGRKLKRDIDIKILLGADLKKQPQLLARLTQEER
jgi:hypothetical protein